MPHSVQPRHARRGIVAVGAALLIGAASPFAAGAAPGGGFVTARPSMLALAPDAPAGTAFQPIVTSGDVVAGRYRYLAVPDGIGVRPTGKDGAMIFVNSETAMVPFPYSAGATGDSFNDFDNAQVSKLILRKTGGLVKVQSAAIVIPSSANFQRFCSNYLALTDGFEGRPMLFTNEETPDWTNVSGTSWTNAASLETAPGARENGLVVAYDLNSSTYQPIWGMGRFNHENTVAVPGYGHPWLMSGDDTFTSTVPQSQVYAYSAASADDVWNDAGQLMAFVSDDADVLNYYDFPRGSTMSVSGHFIPVPEVIATGKLPNGNEVTADTVPAELGGPYPEPPNDGTTWQRRPLSTIGIDGPQWVLEHWSDLHDVFQFTRIEDMAFDKRDGMSNVVYLADSGRGRAGTEAPTIETFSQPFTSSNGRIWKMVLNRDDPMVVDSLSILIEGDDNPVKTVAEIHQPDNLETTVNGLYILEDTGSSQTFTAAQQISDAARATTARVWQYRFSDSSLSRIFKVDQSADEGPTDVDATTTPGRWGDWETTGMVDVSAIYGPGTFLINVQAHTLYTEIDTTSAPDNLGAGNGPDWTYKREGGQLLLVTIPGG